MLAWDAVSASNVAGYKIYYGYASGKYSFSVKVDKTTMASLSGLDQSKVYYIAATVYIRLGMKALSRMR
jgi:hypothetical protein